MKSNVWMQAMLLIAALAMTSCSNNSDEEITNLGSENIELTLTDDLSRAGVGQLIIASVKTETPLRNPTYTWYVDQEEIADTEEINWIPKKAGNHTLEVLIKDGSTKMSIFKQVRVRESDFRYCFWGQPFSAVVINEGINAKLVYNKENDPILLNFPTIVWYVDLEDSNISHAYVFDKDMNVISGSDMITLRHSSYEADLYMDDYSTQRNILNERYGISVTNKAIQLKSYTAGLSYGERLVAGELMMKATWETTRTDIELTMKTDGNGSILCLVIYKPKE